MLILTSVFSQKNLQEASFDDFAKNHFLVQR